MVKSKDFQAKTAFLSRASGMFGEHVVVRKYLFLTSVFVMAGMGGAFAADPVIVPANQFPDASLGEYMQPNHIYLDSAIAENMDGVTEGTVIAVAIYGNENITYACKAGEYLPASANTCSVCPADSYCGGGEYMYTEGAAQGISSCPSGYGTVLTGSIGVAQCYTSCTVANANILHATAVSGSKYYGDNNMNTCSATACEDGYSTHNITPDLNTVIGNTEVAGAFVAINNSGSDVSEDSNTDMLGLTSSDKNAFVVDYGAKGRVRGHGVCSTVPGDNNIVMPSGPTWSNPTKYDVVVDETGVSGAKYCWCHLEGYTPNAGSEQRFPAQFMFGVDEGSDTACANNCAHDCGYGLEYVGNLRTALFNTLVSVSECKANTININWKGTTTEDVTATNAGTCEYGGNINAPRAATEVVGKQFLGWRVKKKTQN